MIALSFQCAQSQFVTVLDESTVNRFLGQDVASCGTSAIGSQSAYSCGNKIVSDVLGINVTDEASLGQQFYLFNDFSYWIQQKAHAAEYDQNSLKYTGSDLTSKLDQDFPATWMYMIVFGTTDYLKQIVAPTVTCPSGQTLLIGQLKYNDGTQIHTWSQTHACVSPTDKFTIQITTNKDGTVPAETSDSSTSSDLITQTDSNGIDWMKDLGPSSDYNKASKCPRSIKFKINS